MESIILLIGGGFFLLIIGSILGFVAFGRVRQMQDKVDSLDTKIEKLQKAYNDLVTIQRITTSLASSQPPADTLASDEASPITDTVKSSPSPLSTNERTPQKPIHASTQTASDKTHTAKKPIIRPKQSGAKAQAYNTKKISDEPTFEDRIISHLQEQWMIWLGGFLVALAGIFLVRYGIERGVLGPVARVVFSLIVGVGLHIGAEYFRRTRGQHNALAALAGAGSITLFGAILAALNLYQLISPTTAFVGLVVVALTTSLLALIHGPLLAAMGLLGAYTVPILVSTGSNNISIALLYVTAVNIGALFLLRFIFRPWLWWGMAGFTGFWWYVGFAHAGPVSSNDYNPLTLYLVGFIYSIFALPHSDWLLRRSETTGTQPMSMQFWRNFDVHQFVYRGCLLIAAALAMQTLILITSAANGYNLITNLLLPVLILLLVRNKPALTLFAWLSLLSIILSLLISHWLPFSTQHWQTLTSPEQNRLGYLLLTTVLVFSGLSGFYYWRNQHSGHWSAMAALTPLLVLIPAYLLLPAITQGYNWAIIAAILAGSYLALAQRLVRNNDSNFALVTLSLTIAAHLGYSLAVVFLFKHSTLTLLLAAQVLSLAYLRKRFNAPPLEWVIKGLVAIILIRLSANPFIANYPGSEIWLIFTYAVCAGFCYLAARIEQESYSFQKWLEIAAVHLFCLLALLLIRYLCNNGQLFTSDYSLTEASLQTLTFGLLAWTYQARSKVSNYFNRIYKMASNITLGIGGFIFIVFVLLSFNPYLNKITLKGFGPFNELILAYGLPAVLLIVASARDKGRRPLLAAGAMFLSFVFVSLQIRLLFHSNIHFSVANTAAELYVFTLAWMALALTGMITSVLYGLGHWYKVSLGMLVLVVAKLFFVDMSGLQGLLRVASFMGMGLCLLALAYGHRWLQTAAEKNSGR